MINFIFKYILIEYIIFFINIKFLRKYKFLKKKLYLISLKIMFLNLLIYFLLLFKYNYFKLMNKKYHIY